MCGWRAEMKEMQPVAMGRQMVGRAALDPPTERELLRLGRKDGLEFDEGEAADLLRAVSRIVEKMSGVMHLAGIELPESPYQTRWPGRAPTPDEDPFNAFVRFCDVQGDQSGPLSGLRVGVKDNIDVAGVPTTNASPTLPGTPSRDATVVERILAAGGRIVGKLNMDEFGMGATGETSAFGPPRNPHNPTRSPGGSSGGSGAALAARSIDLALGGDSGGSARIPAAFCGVVGMMATHGLISNYGGSLHDNTVGAICPMARTVKDLALLLDAIRGEDWRDHQWVRGFRDPGSCSEALIGNTSLLGVRVGIIGESTPEDLCQAEVLENFHAAVDSLAAAGAEVTTVSIPLWAHGIAIAQPILTLLGGAMIDSFGAGYGHLGVIDEDRVHRFGVSRQAEAHRLPSLYKVMLLTSRYIRERYANVPYAHLHNLRLRLRQEVATSLTNVDLLVTPTAPATAPPIESSVSAEGILSSILEQITYNTCPVNMTGNPVIAVPSGLDRDRLPTSAQVIGRHWEDPLVLKAAHAIDERHGNLAPLEPVLG
jgi:amidase